MNDRYDPLGRPRGSVENVPNAPADDLAGGQTDAAFSEGMAGAAFSNSVTGAPTSEQMDAAPYAQDLGTDPYGELSGGFDAGDPNDIAVDDDVDDDIDANREQIEQTRAQMSETIDAIQQKLSPTNMVEQAKDTVRDATIGKAQDMVSNVSDTAVEAVTNVGDTARGMGSGFVDTIKQNPVPAALAGLGLSWLFVSMRKSGGPTTSTYSSDMPYADSQDYTAGCAYGAGETWTYGDTGGVTDRVSDGIGRVQDKASNVASQAQDRARQTTSQVQGAAGFTQVLHSNPLAVGAGALALGVAAGLAIPETQRENQLMGDARDNLAQKAQETLQEKAQKAQTVAQTAMTAGKQEAQDQDLA